MAETIYKAQALPGLHRTDPIPAGNHPGVFTLEAPDGTAVLGLWEPVRNVGTAPTDVGERAPAAGHLFGQAPAFDPHAPLLGVWEFRRSATNETNLKAALAGLP
jgi:hypothetical protein